MCLNIFRLNVNHRFCSHSLITVSWILQIIDFVLGNAQRFLISVDLVERMIVGYVKYLVRCDLYRYSMAYPVEVLFELPMGGEEIECVLDLNMQIEWILYNNSYLALFTPPILFVRTFRLFSRRLKRYKRSMSRRMSVVSAKILWTLRTVRCGWLLLWKESWLTRKWLWRIPSKCRHTHVDSFRTKNIRRFNLNICLLCCFGTKRCDHFVAPILWWFGQIVGVHLEHVFDIDLLVLLLIVRLFRWACLRFWGFPEIAIFLMWCIIMFVVQRFWRNVVRLVGGRLVTSVLNCIFGYRISIIDKHLILKIKIIS